MYGNTLKHATMDNSQPVVGSNLTPVQRLDGSGTENLRFSVPLSDGVLNTMGSVLRYSLSPLKYVERRGTNCGGQRINQCAEKYQAPMVECAA